MNNCAKGRFSKKRKKGAEKVQKNKLYNLILFCIANLSHLVFLTRYFTGCLSSLSSLAFLAPWRFKNLLGCGYAALWA